MSAAATCGRLIIAVRVLVCYGVDIGWLLVGCIFPSSSKMHIDLLGGGNAADFCVIGFGFAVTGLVTAGDDVFDADAHFPGFVFCSPRRSWGSN